MNAGHVIDLMSPITCPASNANALASDGCVLKMLHYSWCEIPKTTDNFFLIADYGKIISTGSLSEPLWIC